MKGASVMAKKPSAQGWCQSSYIGGVPQARTRRVEERCARKSGPCCSVVEWTACGTSISLGSLQGRTVLNRAETVLVNLWWETRRSSSLTRARRVESSAAGYRSAEARARRRGKGLRSPIANKAEEPGTLDQCS